MSRKFVIVFKVKNSFFINNPPLRSIPNRGAFLMKRGSMKEMKVYCPKCKRKVATWDGKSQINVKVMCRNCKKTVLFHVDTKETEIIASDVRCASSGVTFC